MNRKRSENTEADVRLKETLGDKWNIEEGEQIVSRLCIELNLLCVLVKSRRGRLRGERKRRNATIEDRIYF